MARSGESAPPDAGGPGERLAKGVRRAVRTDSTAFGYSILVTSVFGAASLQAPPVTVARLFAFVVGASGSFALWEGLATQGFRVSLRQERSEVLLVGTALAPVSISVGLAMALAVLAVAPTTWSWALAPFAATTGYVAVTGIHLAIARRYEEKHPPEDEE